MDSPPIPRSPDAFSDLLRSLKLQRYERKAAIKSNRPDRQALSMEERDEILAKTAGRCHICGGAIDGKWEADHVFAHAGGGIHRADNYLPAHRRCNNYRWDYSAQEFQHILKLGVWLRTEIEKKSAVGREAAKGFLAHEVRRVKRCAPEETRVDGGEGCDT